MTADAAGYAFAVCLSHDVDRVYKTYQYFYEAVAERDPRNLARWLSAANPYWQFERIMSLEADLGVRSSFNVLDEKRLVERPKTEWLRKRGWQLFVGRYDVTDPQVTAMLRVLADNGWEIGLHGSYTSVEDPERLAYEKDRVESAARTAVIGNRQHYWRLRRPDTWRALREAGVKYDTSLGDSERIGPRFGYELIRPFDDEFVVFPWSLMDGAVMGAASSPEAAWSGCRGVLEDARAETGVVVLDWHQNVFYETDKPGWARTYERLVEEALAMGAWVGPPGVFYDAIPQPGGTVEETLRVLERSDTGHVTM